MKRSRRWTASASSGWTDSPAAPDGAVYRLTDAKIANKTFWSGLERDIRDHLVRTMTVEVPTNKALKLFGTPLRIEFRQDDNPFQETTRVKPVRNKGDVKGRQSKSSEKRRPAGSDAGSRVAVIKKKAAAAAKKKVPGKRGSQHSLRNKKDKG